MTFSDDKVFTAFSDEAEKLLGKKCICALDLKALKKYVSNGWNKYQIDHIKNNAFIVCDCGAWVEYPLAYPIEDSSGNNNESDDLKPKTTITTCSGKIRRMTNSELSRWLWEGHIAGEFREVLTFLDNGQSSVQTYWNYPNSKVVQGDEKELFAVKKLVKIRVNGGEWEEPNIKEGN